MLGTVKVVLLVFALTGFAGNILFVNGSFCNKEPPNGVPIPGILPICEYALNHAYQSIDANKICQVIPGYSGEQCQKIFDKLNQFGIIDYVVDYVVETTLRYTFETIALSLTDHDGQTFEKLYKKCDIKKRIRLLVAKVIPKLITYFGPNLAFHAISKALCFAGDFAQLTLELLGYEKAAKIAGASGNVIGGGLAGFGVGGPLGAVVGAATGLSVWGIGE